MKDNKIIDKLDGFIRKYYTNQLLKGALYAVALLLVLFLVLVFLEHFGWFGTTVRTVLFWIFIAATSVVLGVYVVRPLLKMWHMGKRIGYDDAAVIIGRHFPEVKDKLLNLLQLQMMNADVDDELLAASIDQKSEQLSPVPFLNAIDLSKNRKYIKYALFPLLFIVVILLVAPSFITEPSKRLINHSTYYEKPAPFAFLLQNDDLVASQQDDYQVAVAIEGTAVPNEVFIMVDNRSYRMHQVDKSHYTYLFKNLQHTHQIQFTAAGVQSKMYTLEVLPRPSVVHFQASLSYPAYTKRNAEVVTNEGDLVVPKGTRITWMFQTRDADTLHFGLDDHFVALLPQSNGRVQHTITAMQPSQYAFLASSQRALRGVANADTLHYAISVVDDAFPMIAVMQMTDSAMPERMFFRGQIKDDYGFSKLEFKVLRSNVADTTVKETIVEKVALTSEAAQEFFYSIDLSRYVAKPGDMVKYYFEIWDNDGVNGAKSSRSQMFEINVPTEKEINEIIQQNSSDIHKQAEASISDLQKLQQEINELMRKLVDKRELSWQDKKQLEELKQRHEELKKQMQQMRDQINENNRMEEKYREQNEQILEKQKELDRLFDQVMNDEMKELMKEMDKLLNEMDKKKVQEELDNLKLKNEDIEKQLDQNIELLKRLEIEKKVDQAVRKAEELADKQRKLAEENENKKGDQSAQDKAKEQQRLNDEFQQLKKDIDQIQKDYKDLQDPADFKVDKDLENSIDQHQQDAQQKLGKNKQKEASKSQKQAADGLDKLSEKLAEAQMDIEQSDMAEDSEQLRRLLKNLVQLSFAQEAMIGTLSTVNVQDPKYQQIIVEQNKLKSDFRNVDDSLQALAKRQITVAAVINKEVSAVNSNMAKTMDLLLQYNQSIYGNSRNTSSAKTMQYAMTSLNNLSLVLAESLDQLQSMMRKNQQQKQDGSCKRQGMKMKAGNCSKPGSGKPSPKSMKQMQEELNKQMESLKKQLEKEGKNPGNKRTKIGEHNSMSGEFARMAAQQEQIRRMLQEYGQELKQQSGGNAKLAKEIDEMMRQMEQTETDLVNKTITQQTIRRQQQIMTRLLQHEKAEMQREKEERRESTEGKDIYQPSQGDLEQYKRMKETNMELFHTLPPTLSNFYKTKVNDYFFKQ